ncbi:MAG: hypothetical protein IPK07_09915 [Deltaproteobacteria bacterium]|nr:hypothetical protein [Deltaproteobacteria bacterium]
MSTAPSGAEVRTRRDLLTGRVAAAIEAEGTTSSVSRASWDELALEVFAFQRWAIPAYGRWCEARPRGAAEVETPWRIPAVPTDAFKHLSLFAGERSDVVRTFHTSGTSRADARGAAHFSAAGLALMDVAIDVRARQMLFPDVERSRFLVLAPAPETDPERIMAHGIRRLVTTFGEDAGMYFVGPAGLDVKAAATALLASTCIERPVAVVGASSALAAVVTALAESGARLALPAGSRVMHAGGTKRGAEPVDPAQLRGHVAEWLGVAPDHCVNLLGMTELASQLYDDTIRARAAGEGARRGKVPPPWCRTWSTDPASPEPLPPETVGVLRHLDLANVERPLCVQTDDLGVTFTDGSFEILGRAAGSEARECALDLDEWRAPATP